MDEKELRELDAWLAVNLFGWHQHPFGNWPWQLQMPHKPKNAQGIEQVQNCDMYSSDPADAMEVLKKCAEKGVCVMVWKGSHRFEGLWFCNLTSGGKNLGQAPTLELAICLFCKKLYENSNSSK